MKLHSYICVLTASAMVFLLFFKGDTASALGIFSFLSGIGTMVVTYYFQQKVNDKATEQMVRSHKEIREKDAEIRQREIGIGRREIETRDREIVLLRDSNSNVNRGLKISKKKKIRKSPSDVPNRNAVHLATEPNVFPLTTSQFSDSLDNIL